MEDFNENVTNILNSIKSLYKGCEGIECEDCVLDDADSCSVEKIVCNYLSKDY